MKILQSDLLISSHPNHEVAVFGLTQRLRPHLVFLTDGGGPDRLAETRQGLEEIGLLQNARFLDHPETLFYERLLTGEVGFFREVAAQVRESVDEIRPARLFCDAVELYNPVHDLTLPIVAAALGHTTSCEVYEIPLIHQLPGEPPRYRVQRLPPSRRTGCLALELSDAELDAKEHALEVTYATLREYLSSTLSQLDRRHFAREEVGPARYELPGAGEVALRYEYRGGLLKERRLVDTVITLAGHYRPVASALFGGSGRPTGA